VFGNGDGDGDGDGDGEVWAIGDGEGKTERFVEAGKFLEEEDKTWFIQSKSRVYIHSSHIRQNARVSREYSEGNEGDGAKE
jgi:hypothetical protein